MHLDTAELFSNAGLKYHRKCILFYMAEKLKQSTSRSNSSDDIVIQSEDNDINNEQLGEEGNSNQSYRSNIEVLQCQKSFVNTTAEMNSIIIETIQSIKSQFRIGEIFSSSNLAKMIEHKYGSEMKVKTQG